MQGTKVRVDLLGGPEAAFSPKHTLTKSHDSLAQATMHQAKTSSAGASTVSFPHGFIDFASPYTSGVSLLVGRLATTDGTLSPLTVFIIFLLIMGLCIACLFS